MSAYFENRSNSQRARLIRSIQNLVLPRTAAMANMVTTESGERLVYRRYASLYFIVGLPAECNELLALEEVRNGFLSSSALTESLLD